MIIAKLSGGLGNQLFQYAISKKISIDLKSDLVFHTGAYENDPKRKYSLNKLDIKNIKIINNPNRLFSIISLLESNNILSKFYYIEKESIEYSENFWKNKSRRLLFLAGYFQSYKYFEDIKPVLQKEFVIDHSKLTSSCIKTINDIKNNESVCVHVRRGDYVLEYNKYRNHSICGLDYYYNAINLLSKKITNPRYYIFSDDIEWVKKNIKIKDGVYVEGEISKNEFMDFELMRNCKHFIIANSTFSWWPAWLGGSKEKIVVAPKEWFVSPDKNKHISNILPSEWITI